MFCPKCGSNLPDGATFCGSCGAQLGQPKQAQPAAGMTPQAIGGSAGGAVAQVGGKLLQNPKMLAIVGAVVVVLIVLLVRLVACSGPGQPNLNEIVTSDSATVQKIVGSYKTNGALNDMAGFAFYSNSDSYLQDMYEAETGGSFDETKRLELCKKHSGDWNLRLMGSSGSLSAAQIATGSNPSYVRYQTILVQDNLTADDLAKLVKQVAPYDRCYFGASSDSSVEGASKGSGCVAEVDADADYINGTKAWQVEVEVYSISEYSSGDSYSSSFEREYSSFDPSKYVSFHKE